MDIIKIVLIALAGILFAIQIGQQHPELSFALILFLCALIAINTIQYLQVVYENIKQMSQYLQDDSSYIKLIIKAVGITYVSEFCTEICRDAGFGAIASQIEVFTKFAILLTGFPVLLTLLELLWKGLA